MGGLFPLCSFGNFNYIGPAWWTGDDEEVDQCGFFPLVWLGDEVECAFPLFWEGEKWEGIDFLTLFPLFHYQETKTKKTFITPLGGRGWDMDGETDFLTVLPFFHYSQEEDEQRLITPLGGRVWDKDGETKSMSILLNVFIKKWDGEKTRTSFIWPLITHESSPEKDYLRLFPLFSHLAKEEENSTSALCGLFGRQQKKEGTAMRLFPLFTFSELKEKPGVLDSLSLFGFHGKIRDDKNGSHFSSYMHIGTRLGLNTFSNHNYREVNGLLSTNSSNRYFPIPPTRNRQRPISSGDYIVPGAKAIRHGVRSSPLHVGTPVRMKLIFPFCGEC